MTEDQLRAMTEAQICARYGSAPAYYLEAKLEKKRRLETRGDSAIGRRGAILAPEVSADADPLAPDFESPSLDIRLPGFEILDAALCAVERETPTEATARPTDFDWEPTQHAILQAALEDYGNWPFVGGREAGVAPAPMPATDRESEHARTLELVLDSDSDLDLVLESEPDPDRGLESQPDLDLLLESEPDLDLVLESEPDPEPELGSQSALPRVLASQPEPEHGLNLDLELELDSEPGLDRVLESEPDLELVLESELDLDRLIEPEPQVATQPSLQPVPDNVTVGHFRPRPTRRVRVVSVVMDRKRPNMVRVIGETTRRAG